MSVFADTVDAAVASVIAEHPKLFEAKAQDKIRKLVVRAVIREFTRESKGDAADAPPAAPPIAENVSADDVRAKAYCALRALAGAVPPMRHGDRFYLPAEALTTAVRVFAELPPRADWPFITERRRLIAWREFFDETMPGIGRRDITEVRDGVAGQCLPWGWPPSKTGKIYEVAPEEDVAL